MPLQAYNYHLSMVGEEVVPSSRQPAMWLTADLKESAVWVVSPATLFGNTAMEDASTAVTHHAENVAKGNDNTGLFSG